MMEGLAGIRVIALLSETLEDGLRNFLASSGVELQVVHHSDKLSAIVHTGGVYEVAILPADPPSGAWLEICHQLSSLKPKPSILISFKQDTFEAWSQVLDAGGCGIIVEPYTLDALHTALLGAVRLFHERAGAAQ